jgi:hypothetical protein
MSHVITLPLSDPATAMLSQEADAAGISVEDVALHRLASQPLSPESVDNLELHQIQTDIRELRAASRRLEQKLELVYQLAYFFGKKLATNPSEFHSFVAALKERAQQET